MVIRLKVTSKYGAGYLVNTILHLSLLTAAKLGADASSVWREAASSYLERFVFFLQNWKNSTDLQTLQ